MHLTCSDRYRQGAGVSKTAAELPWHEQAEPKASGLEVKTAALFMQVQR